MKSSGVGMEKGPKVGGTKKDVSSDVQRRKR